MPKHAPFQKGNQFGKGHGRPKKKLICWPESITEEQKQRYVDIVLQKAYEGDSTAMLILERRLSGKSKMAAIDKLDTQQDVDDVAADIFNDWSEGAVTNDDAKTGYDLLMKKRDTIDSAKNERIQIELDGLRQDKGIEQ